MFWCWAKVLCVKLPRPPSPWLLSAQINNGVVTVSAASGFTAEVLLSALPALAPCHSLCPPLCPPGIQGTGCSRGYPFLGQDRGAQTPPWGHSSWWPGTGYCLAMCCSTSSALFSSQSLLSWRHRQRQLSLVGEWAQRTDLLFRVLAQSRPENYVPSINTHMSLLLQHQHA